MCGALLTLSMANDGVRRSTRRKTPTTAATRYSRRFSFSLSLFLFFSFSFSVSFSLSLSLFIVLFLFVFSLYSVSRSFYFTLFLSLFSFHFTLHILFFVSLTLFVQTYPDGFDFPTADDNTEARKDGEDEPSSA